MVGKKRSGRKNRNEPPKKENVEPNAKRERRKGRKRSGQKSKGSVSSKKRKVDHDGQEVSAVRQNEDNKTNELSEELQVCPHVPSKEPKVDHLLQEVSAVKQNDDNKANERSEELQVDPYVHQSIMVGKKRSVQKNRDKAQKEQKVEPDAKRERRKGSGEKRSREGDEEAVPSKEPKVDRQVQEVSGVKQNEDNKVNEQSEELQVDPHVHQVPKVKKEASVGRGLNVNNRHSNQLESLLALMSAKRHPLEVTEDRDKVLKFPGCSSGIYMEWSKKDDQYFLWGSTAEGKIQIKFEFHGGFEPGANLLDVKKPMLAFSESFCLNNCWSEVKNMLQEMFGQVDGEVPGGGYDYMLAFTRIGEMLHFRIFKFHTQPAPDMESMRLEEVSPTFIFKPLEMHCQGDDLTEDVSVEQFIDKDVLMPDMKSDLNLVPCSVLYDDSCHCMIPHDMHPAISHKVMLPFPPGKSLQWLGFNTSFQEFFERYHAYRTTHVPGTGPDPTWATTALDSTADPNITVFYDTITVPMKVFGRGLIQCVKQNHRYGCLSDFDGSNIFLRGGRVLIIGVKLLPYSKEQATKNFRTVYDIIMGAIQGMSIPPDLQYALDLLLSDPLGSYDLIVNNFAWMVASRRHNMVYELQEDFSELGPDVQVGMTQKMPDMNNWLKKFASNRLLFHVLTDKMSKTHTTSLAAIEQLFRKRANDTQKKAIEKNNLLDLLVHSNSPDDPFQLFAGRKYFKGVRNSYVHVSEASVEKNKGPLPKEMVDVVVSSEFAATCCYVQLLVPATFKTIDAKRASYERFKTFFSSAEDIEFEKADEK